MGNSYGTISIDFKAKLGSGRIGTVYKAKYTEDYVPRDCAVKVINEIINN